MTKVDAYIMPEAESASGDAAAPGIERSDAKAINSRGERDLYAKRQWVYPKLAHGKFRNLKWLAMVVTLGVYYALPWLRWNRGPDLPDQAVLLDMANNRFFFFFLEIWPQEFYYVTGLLVLAALALFFTTALAGRVWCGYSCPQTVWTDLMVNIERFWQGDRNDRIRLDKEPWHPEKIVRKAMTHISWMFVGVATGGALVFYFRDAPTLAYEFLTGTAPAIAYLFVGIFAATTYVLGGTAREQVCIYMCPWPRIQGAMIDHETLLVSYMSQRGEPRGPHKKGQPWEGRSDCIDCKACVAVCPTGIDIRDGAQLECIQCALCIDACDGIMDKIGRPRGLVAYSTIAHQEALVTGSSSPLKLIRTRTVLYVVLGCLVSAIMLGAYMRRSELEINVLHDRSPPYVRLSDGSVRNAYTLKILNKVHEPRTFLMGVNGVDGAKIEIVGLERGAKPEVTVRTDDLREVRVLVTVSRDNADALASSSVPLNLTIRDTISGKETARRTNFQRP